MSKEALQNTSASPATANIPGNWGKIGNKLENLTDLQQTLYAQKRKFRLQVVPEDNISLSPHLFELS